MWLRMTRVRTTWTSVLAVLLLSFWPAASACELQCTLVRVTPCCHLGSDGHQPMVGMPGMEQRMDAADTPVLSNASSCPHSVCASVPALQADRSPALPPLTPSTDAVPTGLSMPALAVAPAVASVRGPPGRRSASPVSLHILARV